MSALGAPLQPAELLLLKLAAAILSKPKVVVLNQHFDNIPNTLLKHILHVLEQQSFSILYFTNHHKADFFDGVMNWCLENRDVQTVSAIASQGEHHE